MARIQLWYRFLSAHMHEADIPADFFSGSFFNVLSLPVEEIMEQIKSDSYPIILHIAQEKPTGNHDVDVFNMPHSCVVLGPDHSGEVLVWEKAGNGLPFHILTLREVIALYKQFTRMWVGVREFGGSE